VPEVNADIGIIFGDNQSLINSCAQLGITTVDAKQENDVQFTQDQKCLYQAFDWRDIAIILAKAP